MNASAVNSALPRGRKLRFGEYLLEPDGTLLHHQKSVHLAAKELAALRLLLENAGRIVTAQQLKDALWGNVHVTSDSVPRCISSLRARLENDECIQTVYKQGYRLTSAVAYDVETPAARLPRLAIVPFRCGPYVAEHMGSAVAEDATSRLTAARPPIFSMLARDSAFALTARGNSAHEVGKALAADLVMTGAVQRVGAQYRLRVEMIRVEDGTQIWVEDWMVPQERAAALQAKVVERLAFRMGVGPGRGEDEGMTTDARAFDAFLRGRHEWQSLERHRMQDGVRLLHQAAEAQPAWVQAREHAVRATVAQELLGYIAPGTAADEVRRVAAMTEGQTEAARVILPALGWMKFHVDRDLAEAQTTLEDVEGEPLDPWLTRLRALFAASRHRFDEAAQLLRTGMERDPYSPWMNAALAWTYHLAGEREQSAQQVERYLELIPDHPATRLFGGMILAYQGELDRALALTGELVQERPYFDLGSAAHAYALACRGDRERAEEFLERLQWAGRERYVARSFTAAAYVALGNAEAAMAELRAADEDRCPWFFETLADPRLEDLRAMPEFEAMGARLGEMEAAAVQGPNPALN
ncbi:MAG TPA: winged helix-turn-helix domain-containing protein [Terracidiphilus sp.]|jgi:DNA-binding winged helix-turn-helix (wHTH) protein